MIGVGLILDMVLIALLVGALLFGMRLNARLKALRAGQEAFAKAVAELDDAAIRAHHSLKELRGNADESHELLHGRVVAARELIQKLETVTTRAEKAARSLETGLANQALLQSFAAEPESPAQTIRTPKPLPQRGAQARAPFDRDVVAEGHEAQQPEPEIPGHVLAGLEHIVRTSLPPSVDTQSAGSAQPQTGAAKSAVKPSRRLHSPDEDLF